MALPVVLILGVDDGLEMVDTLSISTILSWWYSKRGPGLRVLALSRRQPIPPGYSTEQHAEDLLWVIEQVQWGPTAVECLSAGGPIGQRMALKAPQVVRALILPSCPPTSTRTHAPSRRAGLAWRKQSTGRHCAGA